MDTVHWFSKQTTWVLKAKQERVSFLHVFTYLTVTQLSVSETLTKMFVYCHVITVTHDKMRKKEVLFPVTCF